MHHNSTSSGLQWLNSYPHAEATLKRVSSLPWFQSRWRSARSTSRGTESMHRDVNKAQTEGSSLHLQHHTATTVQAKCLLSFPEKLQAASIGTDAELQLCTGWKWQMIFSLFAWRERSATFWMRPACLADLWSLQRHIFLCKEHWSWGWAHGHWGFKVAEHRSGNRNQLPTFGRGRQDQLDEEGLQGIQHGSSDRQSSRCVHAQCPRLPACHRMRKLSIQAQGSVSAMAIKFFLWNFCKP